MGSLTANKQRPCYHEPPARILRLLSWSQRPGDQVTGQRDHGKETGHLLVCCCLRRYSCWQSCSACLRTQRAGTGSSSPGGPAAAGTHAMLAEYYTNKKTQQHTVTPLSQPTDSEKHKESEGTGFRDRETVTHGMWHRKSEDLDSLYILLVWLSQT